ncbi:transposase [Erythrobacter litoralis]|uniref:transposase n=1 Tax=Erythrobacter litoralis TaxID=39960 RepID=UPI003AACFD2C
MILKILALQALYSLCDEATEFQIKDWLSFQRFFACGSMPRWLIPPRSGCSVRGW